MNLTCYIFQFKAAGQTSLGSGPTDIEFLWGTNEGVAGKRLNVLVWGSGENPRLGTDVGGSYGSEGGLPGRSMDTERDRR